MNRAATTAPVPVTRPIASPPFVLSLLGVCLAGYLALGKGFSHFGIPPLFALAP